MKITPSLILACFVLLAVACQADVCKPEDITYVADPGLLPTPVSQARATATTAQIEIGGKLVAVDRVVSGPLCNDSWSGTVYIACSLQVVEWEDEKNPAFLRGCDLTIEPGTTVYVAAHNNAAYYNGCSCHTGSATE